VLKEKRGENAGHVNAGRQMREAKKERHTETKRKEHIHTSTYMARERTIQTERKREGKTYR
jgi:hypothetical protein